MGERGSRFEPFLEPGVPRWKFLQRCLRKRIWRLEKWDEQGVFVRRHSPYRGARACPMRARAMGCEEPVDRLDNVGGR